MTSFWAVARRDISLYDYLNTCNVGSFARVVLSEHGVFLDAASSLDDRFWI